MIVVLILQMIRLVFKVLLYDYFDGGLWLVIVLDIVGQVGYDDLLVIDVDVLVSWFCIQLYSGLLECYLELFLYMVVVMQIFEVLYWVVFECV